MRLESLLRRAQADFDHWDQVREELLTRSRDLVRASGEAIRQLHRGKTDEARWKQADGLARQLLGIIKREPRFRHSGFVQQGLGEYAEAVILRHSLEARAPVTPTLARMPGDALI